MQTSAIIASLLLAGLSAAPSLAQGAVNLTLPATADNTLYFSSTGALSNGAGTGIFVGLTSGSQVRRAVVRFDVAGRIPSGSTIQSAVLTLAVSTGASGTTSTAMLHRLLSDWSEGSAIATGGAGGGGAGGPSTPGSTTWIHTSFPSMNWITPGGDFVAAVSASAAAPASPSFVTLSGPGLVADVQAWADGTAQDFGWLIKDAETQTSARRYDSREAGGTGPQLALSFTPPSTFGTVYCNTGANSTGMPASIIAQGSQLVSFNNLSLVAADMPPNQFGIFVTSLTQGTAPMINLCLGGNIGRFTMPSQIVNSGPGGTFTLANIQLNGFPQGGTLVAVTAGETWNFQAWFRDFGPMGQPSSNFTDGIAVRFH